MIRNLPLRFPFHRSLVVVAGAALLLAAPVLAAGADAQTGGFGARGFAAHDEMGMRGWGFGGPGAGMSIERLLARAEELGLTEAQQTKLREIRKQSPAALMPKRQAVEEARIAFQDLMAQQKSSATDLERAHAKVVEARSALEAAQFHLRMQVREVLTPEQRTKLLENAAAMRGGMHRRMRMRPFGESGAPGDTPGGDRPAPAPEHF